MNTERESKLNTGHRGPEQVIIMKQLEKDYPRIANIIEHLWGSSECMEYISGLLTTSRQSREGFSMETITLLSEIMDAHSNTFPSIVDPRKLDVWSNR